MSLKALAERLPEPLKSKLKKSHYYRNVASSRLSDEPDLELLPAQVQKDFVCLDLGANVGVFTKHLAGLSAQVIAAEPIPETFSYLENSVARLRLTNVKLINAAISDQEGMVSMTLPEWSDGRKNIYQASVSSRGGEIPATTVDAICKGLARVDFIKCDVEGHEFQVIQGAKQTIARFHPVWLLETDPHSAAFDALLSAGYRAYVVESGSLRPFTEQKSVNYWFLAR